MAAASAWASRSTPAWSSSATARRRPRERIERVLWNDPATGVMRHADAGYEIAIDCAQAASARPAGHPVDPREAGADPPALAIACRGRTAAGDDRDRRLSRARGPDAFDWRVSMARVEATGPFSASRYRPDAGHPRRRRAAPAPQHPGTSDPAESTRRGAPAPFPARRSDELQPLGLGGPMTDLNVMTWRATTRHVVRRWASTRPGPRWRDDDAGDD